jgi:hypothetical protein
MVHARVVRARVVMCVCEREGGGKRGRDGKTEAESGGKSG